MQIELEKFMTGDNLWMLVSPKGNCFTGETPVDCIIASRKGTVDEAKALARIKAEMEEQARFDDARDLAIAVAVHVNACVRNQTSVETLKAIIKKADTDFSASDDPLAEPWGNWVQQHISEKP